MRSKLFGAPSTITGGDTNSSINVGECVEGEGAGRRRGDAGNNVKHPPFLSCMLISLCPCLLEFPQRMLQLGERDHHSLSHHFLSFPLRPFAEGVWDFS